MVTASIYAQSIEVSDTVATAGTDTVVPVDSTQVQVAETASVEPPPVEVAKTATETTSSVAAPVAPAEIQVTGSVTDVSSGDIIPFVSVQIKGTSTGTITNDLGDYSVLVPSNGVLVFSFIGYQTMEVNVNRKTRHDVALSAASESIDETIVIAYGTAKKESFTGSAAVLTSAAIEKRTVSNVTKAIDGLATGVQVTSGSGQPGSGASIRIRGFGSINSSSNPLYVVDGIPYDGMVAAINPNDIESMTILKDASAGALFGARGANGVIMITTKKGGKAGEKISLNFKGVWGVSSRAIKDYSTMDQKQWMESQYQSFKNNEIYSNGVAPQNAGAAAIAAMTGGSKAIFGENEIYNPYNYKISELYDANGKIRSDATLKWNDNWMDEVTAENPLRQEYNITASGATEKARYMASIGYLSEEGTLATTNFNRFSGRVNADLEPLKWLKFGVNASFSQSKSNFLTAEGTETSNVWYSNALMGPIFPIYQVNAAGEYVLDGNGKKLFDYGPSRPGGAQSNYNAIATLYDDKFSTLNDVVSARTYVHLLDLEEGVLKGLKLAVNFGFDYRTTNQEEYSNPFFGNAAGSSGSASRTNQRTLSYTFNQILSYTRTFADKHNLDVMVGHEFYDYDFNNIYTRATGFPFGGLYELGAASLPVSANSYKNNYSIESYFARLNYDYDDKYYFSASYRRDGSSRFVDESRWGNFWSVGANWRISQEEFMKSVSWINNLNIKASYGVQGNDAILNFDGYPDYYPWQALYDLTWTNAGAPGAIVKSIENTDLRWEKNGNFNIGLDARLFDRLSISVEYYNRRTDDMLMSYPTALSTGFTGYNKNIGSMKNSGIEATIAGDLFIHEDFRWTLTLMGSTVRNEVLTLADKPEIVSGNYIIKVGEVLNSFYLPRGAGVDPATGLQLYHVWDTDEDGNITERYVTSDREKAGTCREIVGDRMPTLYGSIGNSFTIFKNFDLSVLCTYSIGGEILDGRYNTLMTSLYPGNAMSTNRLRAWQEPGDITDVPRLINTDESEEHTGTLIDASYFAIKNITLGYSFPQKWMKRIGIQNLRISAIADNIALFTHLQGMNPQNNFSGGTSYVYTPSRTISFGLDITF